MPTSSPRKTIIGALHAQLVSVRRRQAIAKAVHAGLIECHLGCESLLDVGCGAGSISATLAALFGGMSRIEGVELVLPAVQTEIPVSVYDGRTLPFPDKSFDAVFLCDVLHHVPNPTAVVALLSECRRVASKCVIVKDHPIDTRFDHAIISFLDTLGNWQTPMPMPMNFMSRTAWKEAFRAAGLSSRLRKEAPFGIHPPVIRRFAEMPFWSKPFHFIEILVPSDTTASRNPGSTS